MTYQLTDDDRAAIEMAEERMPGRFFVLTEDRMHAFIRACADHTSSAEGDERLAFFSLGILAGFALAREAAALAAEDSDVIGNRGYHPGGDDGSRTLRGAAKNIRALTLAQAVKP